jgi:hypothetical protein
MPARLNPVPGKKFHALQPAFIRFAGIRVFASLLHSVGRTAKTNCQRRLLALAKEKQAGGFD